MKKQLSIRIDEDLYEEIKKIADGNRLSVAQVIGHGIRVWLGLELAKAEAKQSWERGQENTARMVVEQGLVPIEIPVPIEATRYVRDLQMTQHREMIIEDNAKRDAYGARTATGIEAVDKELGSKKFAVEKPLAGLRDGVGKASPSAVRFPDRLADAVSLPDSVSPLAEVEEKHARALAALAGVGMTGTPERMQPFKAAPFLESVPYVPDESAPVKLCVACEANLVTVKGKWVCDHTDCGLYGTEQKGKR